MTWMMGLGISRSNMLKKNTRFATITRVIIGHQPKQGTILEGNPWKSPCICIVWSPQNGSHLMIPKFIYFEFTNSQMFIANLFLNWLPIPIRHLFGHPRSRLTTSPRQHLLKHLLYFFLTPESHKNHPIHGTNGIFIPTYWLLLMVNVG